ncbi:hypothetical protein FCV25MIE_28215 [Fagus crenata]
MIIEEEDSDDDVEVDDEELDDMDRLATEVYTKCKQPSDEDMPYVDEEDRRYWEGLLSENEDLFDVHLPDMQPTGGNVNIQVGVGCTSNLLQLVGVTTNNVNMNTIDSISSQSMPLVSTNKVASPNKQRKKGVGSKQGRAFFVGDEHGNVVHPKQKKRPRESGPSIQAISKRTLMSNIRSTQ